MSISTSDRPGPSESTTLSSLSVTSSALAPGNFSTTISRPGPSVKTASPISGWWSSTTVATSLESLRAGRAAHRRRRVVGPFDGHPRQVLRRLDRLEVLDADPLGARVEEAAGAGGRRLQEGQRRHPQGVARRADDLVERHALRAAAPSGRPAPGAAVLADPTPRRSRRPGCPSAAGRIVQRARTPRSMSDRSSEDRPIIISRLVDDSGWIICGGRETFGRAAAWVRRSFTTCRALPGSVPGSKMSSIFDIPGSDSERITSRNATPLSRSCSSGTVTSCSTSSAESPSASVCTCTVTGENSGSESRGMSRSCTKPRTTRPMPERDDQALRLPATGDQPTHHRTQPLPDASPLSLASADES